MSLVFAEEEFREGADPKTSTVQKLLDENNQLIARIRECQLQGRPEYALPFQKLLQRNLVFLAEKADKVVIRPNNEDDEEAARKPPEYVLEGANDEDDEASARKPPQYVLEREVDHSDLSRL